MVFGSKRRNKPVVFSVRVTEDQAEELQQAHVNAAIVGKLKSEYPALFRTIINNLDYLVDQD